jgi:hypothetical protein
MARALKNAIAFLAMVCIGVVAGCVIEAEDLFDRHHKRDMQKIQRSG